MAREDWSIQTGKLKQSYFDGVVSISLRQIKLGDKKLLLEFTSGAQKIVELEPHSGLDAFTWSSVNKCTKSFF